MSTVADYSTAAQAVAATILASTTDPEDALRMLAQLADFNPADPVPSSPVGNAMGVMQDASGDLFRRAAVIAMARASATYQPASYDAAVAARNLICTLLDNEILIAGDQGEDATFTALRALRAAVVQDLDSRASSLATIMTVQTNQAVPAPVLAQRLYLDPSRADELVANGNPPHPAFMPVQFKALSE